MLKLYPNPTVAINFLQLNYLDKMRSNSYHIPLTGSSDSWV
jgi:hypothetical protein